MRDKFEWRTNRNKFNHSHDADQAKLPDPEFFSFNFNGQSRFQAWFVNMKSNMKSIRSTQAFTLVEVLVVLGLIMLLAALLFPALSRAREGGRRTACLSNLSQIAKGLQIYTQDNNRRFPPLPPPQDPSDLTSGPDGSKGWALSIADTLKNDVVFQCPSQGESNAKGFTDYWLNGDLQGKSDVRLRTPSSVILAGDGVANSVDYAVGPNVIEPWVATDSATTRHLGGANYAFADGHIKWLLPEKISLTDNPNGTNYTFVIG